MRRTTTARRIGQGALAACMVSGLAHVGCGGGSSGGGFLAPVPVILDVNGSTDPASPVGLAIEVNGTGFLSSPGRVTFSQGSNVAEVTPDSAGWSDTGIVVLVPASGAGGAFTVPGTVTVNVVTSGGVSNGEDVDLVVVPTFEVNNVTWTTTTALPEALRGLGAAIVPRSSTEATLVVTGGNDGAQNEAAVHVAAVAADGTVGTWQAGPALPAPRAHHASVVAHDGNSLVNAGAAFVYAIGGQEDAAGTPGGTTTVFMASVSGGGVGAWSSTTALPEALLSPAATVYNGFVYVVGGLQGDGATSRDVYTAPIDANGTLGTWTAQADLYPTGIAFARSFGFGGSLYMIGGDGSASTDPNAQGAQGTSVVQRATARRGAVGAWASAASTVKQRQKHVVWTAFGQVLAAEGVYEGAPGSLELERTLVQSDGSLASWNGITSTTNQINANVYNAAAVVSPIRPSNAGPRFLLLGGQAFTATPPGALSAAVYVNTAP